MSFTFNMVGGGAGKAYAVIAVTYPAGSTITCVSGTKSLKAQGADGQAIFLVPYAATWTVTITDGTYTASKNVVISTEGQSVNLGLSYALYLYKNGDECTDVTGGWVEYRNNGEVSLTNNGSTLNFTNQLRTNIFGAGTANKVSIDGHHSIRFSGTVTLNNATYPVCIALVTEKNSTSFPASQIAAQAEFPSAGTYEDYSIMEIATGLSGEFYVAFLGKGDNGNSFTVINNVSVSEMWLQ